LKSTKGLYLIEINFLFALSSITCTSFIVKLSENFRAKFMNLMVLYQVVF